MESLEPIICFLSKTRNVNTIFGIPWNLNYLIQRKRNLSIVPSSLSIPEWRSSIISYPNRSERNNDPLHEIIDFSRSPVSSQLLAEVPSGSTVELLQCVGSSEFGLKTAEDFLLLFFTPLLATGQRLDILFLPLGFFNSSFEVTHSLCLTAFLQPPFQTVWPHLVLFCISLLHLSRIT